MKKIILYFYRSIQNIARMVLVAGILIGLLILTVDNYTNPKYGTDNIVGIIAAFVFVPSFVPLLIEFTLANKRKRKRELEKEKEELKYQKS